MRFATKTGGRDVLLEVCNHLVAGWAPGEVREWLAGARLVALLKDDLGVNGRHIACGKVLRKLMAKVICTQRAEALRGFMGVGKMTSTVGCGRPRLGRRLGSIWGSTLFRQPDSGTRARGERGPVEITLALVHSPQAAECALRSGRARSPSASAVHDDFTGYLTYSPNHSPDVTVLDAEGPGGGEQGGNGDVRPHQLAPFGMEVYGGLGPGADGFLKKMRRRFRERRYMKENVGEEEDQGVALGKVFGDELVEGVGGEARAPTPNMGKGLDVRRMDVVVVRKGLGDRDLGSSGGQTRRGRRDAGEAGRMASRLLESVEDVQQEAENLRAAELRDEAQGLGTAEAWSAEVSVGASGPSQQAALPHHLSVQDTLAEGDGLVSPGPECGVATLEQSGASPAQALL
ncbi:hypothetical protein CYMTET_5270 [Cymbomonas tetramitiformis]|uniref:Uncharacterized protein n=1 Tax=Cymbomonas tetramitiformis TaxID=36881 RepID=A0AAE0LJ88_9CHLO|nr:hypothetical protein CYMTET_5270 [Cymbomonas tetramitiformis]